LGPRDFKTLARNAKTSLESDDFDVSGGVFGGVWVAAWNELLAGAGRIAPTDNSFSR
jgi:hypothetical protein